jgi:hypothetical protein
VGCCFEAGYWNGRLGDIWPSPSAGTMTCNERNSLEILYWHIPQTPMNEIWHSHNASDCFRPARAKHVSSGPIVGVAMSAVLFTMLAMQGQVASRYISK